MILLTFKLLITGASIILIDVFLQPEQYEKARERMVAEQIEARGINNQSVLDAMRKVPRHLLIPEPYRVFAYTDRPLPIGYGQTISQPFIVAQMTELIEPRATFKVLEIGTGSGYQAAVLAEIVKEVYTVELVKELGQLSAEQLKELGYNNIHIKIGDGYEGWADHAPYDAIIVTAAATSVPQPLVDQLKEGGKMVLPVGGPSETQMLKLLIKKKGKINTRDIIPVRFVPFIHEGN
jgi:protein-L-isoaspartate(D-aspartate) O-methyltransferase